jgi:hypothetical protein
MVMLGKTRDVTTSTRSFGRVLSLVCAVGLPATASAEDAPAGAPAATGGQGAPQAGSMVPQDRRAVASEVRAHHAPVSVGASGTPLSIEAAFENIHLLRQAVVVYRLPDGTLRSVAFQRSGSERLSYIAVLPGEKVVPPGLDYTIEVERVDGVRAHVFASRTRMHHVQVSEAHIDAVERVLLKRLDRRRSTAAATLEGVNFGATREEEEDYYLKAELSYMYQPLQTIAEFTLRVGVMRGSKTSDETEHKALYYATPSVRFRLSDWWHVEAELIACLTHEKFCVGAGGAVLIGDPYSSKITLGFETFGPLSEAYFGSRFYTRVDFPAADWLSLAPMIELTDMPQAGRYGVQLVGEATVKLWNGISAGLRGGYCAREPPSNGVDAPSNGVGVGGHVAVSF